MLTGLYSGMKALLAIKSGYDESAGTSDEKLVNALVALKKETKNNAIIKYDGNMANVLGEYIVEPVIIISNNVARDDISKQVLELNMDLFCSYYIQVYEILKVADGMSGKEAVTLLSTDNDSLPAAIRDYSIDNYLKIKAGMSFESLTKLQHEDVKFGLESLTVSLEAVSKEFAKAVNELYEEAEEEKTVSGKMAAVGTMRYSSSTNKNDDGSKILNGKDIMAGVQADVDGKIEKEELSRAEEIKLAIKNGKDAKYRELTSSMVNHGKDKKEITESDYKGYELLSTLLYKTFYVDYNMPLYTDESKTEVDKYYRVRFPITIKARIIFANPEDVVNMIVPFNTNVNFFSRLEDYRSSAIGFFKDLVWCDDLIKEAKKAKLNDDKNLIKLINDRTSSANAKMFNNKPGIGFEKNYNMLILAEDDIVPIERAIGGKLKDEVNMKKLLKVTQSLSCTIVDFDYERVNMSLSGGIGKSSTTFQALKKKGNNGKEDLTELVKMLMANKAMTF